MIGTKLYIQYCVAYLTSEKMSRMHMFTQNNIPKIKKQPYTYENKNKINT